MARTVVILAAALALLSGTMATPAAAQNDFGFIVNGQVVVGEPPFSCTKAGGVDPAGRGLQFPQLKDFPKDGGGANKDRVYRLTGVYHSAVKGSGSIDICGNLTKVAGIGPRCGWQKGYNGKGLIRYANGDVDKISDFGWKLYNPVIGRVHKYDPWTGKKSKPGRIIGFLQAVPAAGESCANGWNPFNADRNIKGQGARRWTVTHGVFMVEQFGIVPSWNAITDPIDPKNDGKSSATNIWGDKKDKKPQKSP